MVLECPIHPRWCLISAEYSRIPDSGEPLGIRNRLVQPVCILAQPGVYPLRAAPEACIYLLFRHLRLYHPPSFFTLCCLERTPLNTVLRVVCPGCRGFCNGNRPACNAPRTRLAQPSNTTKNKIGYIGVNDFSK